MTLPAYDHPSRRRVLGSLAAIPVIQALQGATATPAQTTAIAPDRLTAIDIALEPDATMIRHAKAANARLLKNFPKGFALDATHHPHVSMLQQFARTADLDKICDAAASVFRNEKPLGWKLRAFKYYYIPSPPLGLAGIVAEPTDDLHRLQNALIDAVTPFTVTSHGDQRNTGGVLLDRGGPRHTTVPAGIRGPIRDHRGRREVQSACHDRCRHRGLSETHARRAVRGLHVLPVRRIGLSSRKLRHCP